MAQYELQEGRIPRPDQNRLQWRSSFGSGSESKMCLSNARMMSKDKNDDGMRCSPVSLSDNGSAKGRAFCPKNMGWKPCMELNCAAFDDEYQPLPSPTQFCQKTRQCARGFKERTLFTAAHGCADVHSEKRPTSQADVLPATVAQRPEAWCFPISSSRGRPEWGPASLSESSILLENFRPHLPCSGLCASSMSTLPQGMRPASAAPDTEKALQPSGAMRGDSEANRRAPGITPLDIHDPTDQLKEASSFWKVSYSHRSSSVDRLWNSQGSPHCHNTQRHSPPDSPAKLESNDLRPLSQRTTTSAYHPLTAAKNHPARVRAQQEHSLPSISELSSVLRQLLYLVEQHWNGPQSLQLNPQFLTPAYDLLASLVTTHSIQRMRGRSPPRMTGVDENGENRGIMKDTMPRNLKSSVLKQQKNQPTQKQQPTESLKKGILTAVEDRNSLNCETPNRRPEAAFSVCDSAGRWEQCLQRQVAALQEQERHFQQLEETVGLLQDSHRSLISSNNTLMEHLNSPRSPHHTDSQKLL